MTDTDAISLSEAGAFDPGMPAAAPATPAASDIPNDKVIDQDEMTLALNYANLMGKRGISVADREKFLAGEMALQAPGKLPQKQPGAAIPLSAAGPAPANFADVKGGATTHTPTFLDQANNALRNAMASSFYNPLGPSYKAAGQDVANIGGEAISYAKNFGVEHETMEPGPVTPEEMKQAKVMGIPSSLLNADEGGFVWKKDPNTGEVVPFHPTIYKMPSTERQALDDKSLEGLGLDSAAERARSESLAKNPFGPNADPIANITVNNAIGNFIQEQLNPHMAATKQYEALQQTMVAQKIVHYPQFHSEEEVAAAMNLLDNYKNNVGKGWVEKTQDLLEEIKADPTTKLGQFAVALAADPELAKLGKLRLGNLLYEAKIASLTADMQKAQQAAAIAKRVQGVSELDLPTGLDQSARIAAEEGKAAQFAKELKSTQRKEILGNIVSEPIIGGATNVALDRQAQMKEHGYVEEGSEAAPFAQGAALGGLAAAGESLRLLPKRAKPAEVPIDQATPPPAGATPGTPPPPGGGGTAASKAPGASLPPDTPINKTGHVPATAGVDASGDVVHVDSSIPDKLPMKNVKGETVNVPVTGLIAYHESVEAPLMHLTGPMASADLIALMKKVHGEGTIPKDVIAKLKNGESLTYAEAHDIATMAENQRVRALYNVHPDVYQGALDPYIKRVTKANKTAPASSIPPTLDTKPYEETGTTDQLKGQGAKPEDQPTPAPTAAPAAATREPVPAPSSTPTPTPKAKLPQGLGGAKPRYGYGTKQFGLEFASDADKAAYIAATKKSSKRVKDYAAFAAEALGMTPEEVVARGKALRDHIKGLAKDAAPGLLKVGALGVAGAAIGSYLDPENRKEGAISGATFIPLLSRVHTHGESLGTDYLSTNKRMRGDRAAGVLGSPEAKAIAAKLDALVAKGVSPEAIWHLHGFYQDPKGNWLHEIPDSKMSENKGPDRPTIKIKAGDKMPLSRFINHPNFEKAYPWLWKKLNVEFNAEDTSPGAASFDPKTYTLKIHQDAPFKIITHELGHAVQDYEGLPPGANRKGILYDLYAEKQTAMMNLYKLKGEIDEHRRLGEDTPPDLQAKFLKAVEKYKKFPTADEGMEALARQKYEAVMGEVQANTAMLRHDYNAKMRKEKYPGTQITSLEEQWDRARSGEVMQHEEMSKKDREAAQKDAADRERLTPKASEELPHEKEHLMLAENGNQKSIATLYNHYMPRLIRTMDRYMRVAGPRLGLDGEDLAQRAFYKAITSLPEFKGQSSFYTWLYAIAKNTALDVVRQMKLEVPTTSMFTGGEEGGGGGRPSSLTGKVGFGGEPAGGDPVKASVHAAEDPEFERVTPEMSAAQKEISSLVQQAIDVIPKKMGDVLRARQIEGLTDVETARKLGMAVGTVRSYNVRGQQMLAQIFKGSEVERNFKAAANIKKQGGAIDPELLKRLAKFAVLAGGGAALGANYFDPQHPYKAMVQGAGLALIAGQVNWKNVYNNFRKGIRYDPDLPFKEYLNQYNWDIARGDRLTATTRFVIDRLVNTEESRVKISQHLDGNTAVQLTPREQQAADHVKALQDQLRQDAINSGVLHNYLDTWIRQTWKPSVELDQFLTDLKKAFKVKPGQPKLLPVIQRALFDEFTSLAVGKSRGLVPESEDVNFLIGNHVDSQTRALANQLLVGSLKNLVVDPATNMRFLMPGGKAPGSYVSIDHNQLSRYKVHPSLAPSLEYIFHNKGGGAAILAAESMNTAVKRVQVNLSLFHAKSLFEAHLSSGEFGHPWRNFVDAAESAAGKSRGHEAYLSGGPGDDIDYIIRALKIAPRKGNVPVEDVNSGFYEGLKMAQNAMDEAVPNMGKLTAGSLITLSKALDHFLWENVHSGLKLTTAMNVLERLRRSYAKEVAKDPLAHVPSTAELADMAASYTNDTFGGVDWRRMADDARTQWGREVALALGSPIGRRISQVMMFAPDWTYSTVRSFIKTIGPGSFGGLLNPKTVADLHRLYWIRSAFIYATLLNGVNFAFSGHAIWNNKRNGQPEPFLIDLGNGEWAQASKHAMEVPQLIKDAVEEGGIPSKWLLGKLGNIPSEALDQALNREYIDPRSRTLGPPMQESRLAHFMKRGIPFSAKSFLDQGPWESLSSALGVPITGHPNKGESWTPSMKEQDWEKVKDAKEQRAARKQARDQKRTELLLGGDK